MNKRKIVVGVVSFVVLIIAVIVVLGYLDSLDEALGYIRKANPWILSLLIPNIVLMYYAAGRIWYPYLHQYRLSPGELAKIQYELNFVNTVVPILALSGLIYSTERLRRYGVDSGCSSWLYLYRYIVSITTNWIGIIGSVSLLLCMGKLNDMPVVPLMVTTVIVFLAMALLVAIILALTCKTHFENVRIDTYIRNLREALSAASTDKKALYLSWAWGMVYTILEDTPFLIVASAMGHPELFLQMIVAAAAGIIIGVFIPTPGGIGGFDGAMIYLMGGLGTNIALASSIVLTTRVLVLFSTTVTGYPFWQRGMVKIGQKD